MSSDDVKRIEQIHAAYQRIDKELRKVIVGQNEIIKKLLIALLARGHCLLVGVPGLAKTLIIKTLGEILGLSFSRIQFTPDLMPSDITGAEVLEEDRSTGKKMFRFIKGPVFANIILADEINRTPPKTQSALLEAMQEYRVTTAGQSFGLDMPFFVLATQNPIEQEGTYPLPEAQLDRFMFSLWLDYPAFDEEITIVKQTTALETSVLEKQVDGKEIMAFQDTVRRIPVTDNVVEYAVKLVSATRHASVHSDEKLRNWVRWGAGPRASQYLVLGAKVNAVLENRLAPDVEDVRFVAEAVLRHRILTTFSAEADGVTVEEIVKYIIDKMEG